MSNPLSPAQIVEARAAQDRLFHDSHYPAHQPLCPTCTVDRDVLREGMAEGRESPNYEAARRLIYGCRDCSAWAAGGMQ